MLYFKLSIIACNDEAAIESRTFFEILNDVQNVSSHMCKTAIVGLTTFNVTTFPRMNIKNFFFMTLPNVPA